MGLRACRPQWMARDPAHVTRARPAIPDRVRAAPEQARHVLDADELIGTTGGRWLLRMCTVLLDQFTERAHFGAQFVEPGFD